MSIEKSVYGKSFETEHVDLFGDSFGRVYVDCFEGVYGDLFEEVYEIFFE